LQIFNLVPGFLKPALRPLYFGFMASQYLHLRDAYEYELIRKYKRDYEIHPSVTFGVETVLYGDGKIKIGEGSYLGRNCFIASYENSIVQIGQHCAISNYVAMYTLNRLANQDFAKTQNLDVGDVIIGDYSWIGFGVYINQGVTIGKNCVIGAHSVVVNDIPDFSIAAGAPARVVKEINR
jgi:maltose O-acetyltransferase